MKYQVTMYDKSGKYKPVSCIVSIDENTSRKEIMNKGVKKICNQRYWTKREVIKYNYLTVKMREVEENGQN